MTTVQYAIDSAGKVGRSTIRATFEVAADGQSLSAVYTIEFVETGVPTGQMGPGTATATRIVVEPMGTPVMPLGGPAASPDASTAP